MLEIERATASDFPAIDQLARLLHGDEVRPVTVVRQTSRTFVARDAGAVVGFAIATLTDYGINISGQLEELAVGEAGQRSGTGRALVAACEAWLAGEGVDVVFVSSLTGAVGFYEAMGYQPCTGPWLYRVLSP
ncbi:MAG TPA: GNAT family N-acetyltransferase [Caulobacteraceae bacterium]|jgi:predicted N-acetyltransferase YhbS|nr:GNAT family N-acetyltransferase [Caulobacteraceae bacterium]